MKVLVCGGRDYADSARVSHCLAALSHKHGIDLIIEGGALGADRLARDWAIGAGVLVQTFHADWKRLGRRAGPERNARMLDQGKPDAVIAFPGGRGTADMVSKARAAAIHVWEVT